MTVDELKGEITNWKITRHRLTDLTIAVCTLILHEFIAKPYYRSFVYSNDLFDFHIADTLGNSLGTIVAIFIVVGLLGSDTVRNHFLIKITTISMIMYELAQPLLGKRIDPWDIIATIFTGGLCLLLYGIIHRVKQIDSAKENI